ncbi:MAG: OmpA family protein [Deltaproteobacteria bacterium]|nr:OmpA family protein [Deltaproteobacteria bacterium]MCW5803522.1 OmpA family protein [Deltaproteobacteria bacterium]
MNRLLRPAVVTLAALSLTTLAPAPAQAGVEIGGTAGIHVFSLTNELGVPDISKDTCPDIEMTCAPSQRNSALFGLRIGVFFGDMLGVEAELGVVPSEARQLVFDVWNLVTRAHLVAQFRAKDPNNKLIPFGLIGGGAMSVVSTSGPDTIAKDTDAMLYAGAGIKYRVDNGWGLRLDARVLFPPSSKDEGFTQDFELLLSIYKEFGRKQPEKKPPPPDLDPDKDGIIGDADKCPNEPEDKDGFQDEDGCPDPDNDGDGIADAQDKCPNEPEDMDGFKDDDGCPDLDNDGDGIPDAQDKCPNEPEDKDGFQDEDGCPDPDNDGDGVPDELDQCPTEQETKNGYKDDDGCPDEVPAPIKKFTGVIAGINFAVNDVRFVGGSTGTLDKAVAVLKEYGDLKLEIQGHTDDQAMGAGGKFTDNQALSQARADAVRDYFKAKGIAEDRLTAKGYGDTVPAVPTTAADGTPLKGAALEAARAKNRRVEFKLVSALTSP